MKGKVKSLKLLGERNNEPNSLNFKIDLYNYSRFIITQRFVPILIKNQKPKK